MPTKASPKKVAAKKTVAPAKKVAKVEPKKSAAAKLVGPLAKLIAKAKGKDIYDAGEAMSKIVALGSKAAPARDELRALVADKEPRRSLRARAALAVLDDDRDAHLDAILIASATGKGGSRPVASVALKAVPAPLVAQAIARGLRSKNAAVRKEAVSLCGSIMAIRKAIELELLPALLDDADEDVRAMTIHAIQMLVAAEAPAKSVAKLTPALRTRIDKMRTDSSKKVAARAQRFVDEVK